MFSRSCIKTIVWYLPIQANSGLASHCLKPYHVAASISFRRGLVSCSILDGGKKLRLVDDGEGKNETPVERRYHGVWLRHNCRCPQCWFESLYQNIVPYEDLMDLEITKAETRGEEVLVEWTSRTGNHSCLFNVDWLKKHDYTSTGILEARNAQEEPLIADEIPLSDYEEAMASPEGYYKWMEQVSQYGFTLMKNIPTIDEQLVKFTEQIAEPQQQPFNRVFDVKSKPNASTAAYTTGSLPLHSDQAYLGESVPGIQLLHCLRFDDCIEGGVSGFVDSYPILQELRVKYPRHFNTLATVPSVHSMKHSTLNEGKTESIDFTHYAPHIGLDYNQKIIRFTWNPSLHYPIFASEQDVEDYYEAYTVLSSMFNKSPRKFNHRLRPGEAFIFNNRRMLHSRTSFTANGGDRHLQGFYLNLDYFRSRLVVLAEELGKATPIKHMFNASYYA